MKLIVLVLQAAIVCIRVDVRKREFTVKWSIDQSNNIANQIGSNRSIVLGLESAMHRLDAPTKVITS